VTRASTRAQRQAEQQFPVRVRIVVPPAGLGRQLEIMHGWLDKTCGPDGWMSAPAGLSGIANDAIAFYFDDPAFAHAFVVRFCCGYRVETIGGAFAIRDDTPLPRRSAPAHKTP
jgi:fructose-specific phosphotransferase system IIC component